MVISFVIASVSNIGGISRVLSILSDAFVKKNECVINVISYCGEIKDDYGWNENINFYSLLDKMIPMKYGIFKSSVKLNKIIKKTETDILVSCGSVMAVLSVIVSKINGKKVIYWDHSNFDEKTSHLLKKESKIFASLFSDVVVPLTKKDASLYLAKTKAKRVEQIYNPIDPKLSLIKSKYSDCSRKILSVGRLSRQKNFIDIIKAGSIVFEKNPDWEWHIYGSGEQYNMLLSNIKLYGLEKNIILMGSVTDLYNRYSEYSMLVVTSIYEGFPMVMLEAMKNKLPLISYDILTGPNEIIIDGDNGYLIKKGDYLGMAKKINLLIEDKKERLRLSDNNNKYIDAFELDEIVDKWCALFKSILKTV